MFLSRVPREPPSGVGYQRQLVSAQDEMAGLVSSRQGLEQRRVPAHSRRRRSSHDYLLPFFAAAIDSRMIEAEENSIDLPFPKPTIEVAARYLYGQSLEMDFDEAAHLLVMAQMYDLPELLSLAVERAKKEPLDAQKAILLWQKAFEARNEDMRGYSMVEITQMKLEISDSKLLEGLSREELLSLFVEVFSVKGQVKK